MTVQAQTKTVLYEDSGWRVLDDGEYVSVQHRDTGERPWLEVKLEDVWVGVDFAISEEEAATKLLPLLRQGERRLTCAPNTGVRADGSGGRAMWYLTEHRDEDWVGVETPREIMEALGLEGDLTAEIMATAIAQGRVRARGAVHGLEDVGGSPLGCVIS